MEEEVCPTCGEEIMFGDTCEACVGECSICGGVLFVEDTEDGDTHESCSWE